VTGEDTMDTTRVELLFEYNRWANRRTREAVARATSEQFTREIGGSYGSLRNTVAHLMASEWVWLRRWKGTSPTAPPFPNEELTLENVGVLWQPIEAETEALVASLTAERLEQAIDYRSTRGDPFSTPLWQQLQHVVNHSTYHRGQVVTLLRQLDVEPIGSDLIAFYRGRDRR
jgi:uncharacterized damage-inducible protein DinB